MLRTFCRTLGLLAMGLALPLLFQATPASALTSKQKMETCRIGAKAQKLTGAKRTAFIRHCMAKGAPLKPPPHRLTAKAKMATCKAGARDLKYTGAKRAHSSSAAWPRATTNRLRRAVKQQKHTMKKPTEKTTPKKKN